jgi:hypothetical protein
LNGGPYRGGMSRDPRQQMQGPPRESRLYMRAVGFDPDSDFGGRAACRIARVGTVKVDQIFDEDSGVQYDRLDMKGTKQLGEEKENPVEEGMKTRGQLARKALEEKRKSAELNISEGKEVQSSEGRLRTMLRNRGLIRRNKRAQRRWIRKKKTK